PRPRPILFPYTTLFRSLPHPLNGATGTPEISAVSPNTSPAFTSLQRRRALSKKETPWLLEECLGSSLLYSRFYGRSWRLNTPISDRKSTRLNSSHVKIS